MPQPVYSEIGARILAGETLTGEDWESLRIGALTILATTYPNVRQNDREDAAQEIVALAFRKLDTFKDAGCAFTTWFYKQARTAALRWIEAARAEKRAGRDRATLTVSMTGTDGENWIDVESEDRSPLALEAAEVLANIRNRLAGDRDPRLLEILEMMGRGFKGVEIAQALNTSPQRVDQLRNKIREIAQVCA